MPTDCLVAASGVAITVAQDLFELVPADDKPIKATGFELGQSTEVGDAAEENVRLAVRRGNTTSGSGGSTPTVNAADPHGASPAVTAEANNTTKATTAGATILSTGWNERVTPMVWWYPDQFAPGADQGNSRLCIELVAAPADSVTVEQTAYVKEF